MAVVVAVAAVGVVAAVVAAAAVVVAVAVNSPINLVEDGASLATVGRASCPRRLEACTTNGRQIYASDY